jgi:hypothetical protein
MGMTAFGYAAMTTKDFFKGRNPRPMFDKNGELQSRNFMAAFLQGGGAGIFGDLMFGPETRYGHSSFESMLGPSASMFADATNMYSSYKAGKDMSSQLTNFARNHGLPGQNIWWARGALDYGLWYSLQEWNNPGYTNRMKRRVKQNQDQTFWLNPNKRLRPFE